MSIPVIAESTVGSSPSRGEGVPPIVVPEKPKDARRGQENAKRDPVMYEMATSQAIPKFVDFASQRHWQLRHMVATFRHWHREGYVEGMSGLISARDPEWPNAFWVNPMGVHFALIKIRDMVLTNVDGEVIGGSKQKPMNSAGFSIHASIHKARPDAHVVCHAHSIHGKAWSVFGKKLDMLTRDACKFLDHAQGLYNGYGKAVFDNKDNGRIAKALGPKGKGCLLRNHGLLTVGQTVDEAAFLLTSMEKSCRVQLLAEAASSKGLPKVLIPYEEALFNFTVDSDPQVCYKEFQIYYDLEEQCSEIKFE